MKKEFLLENGVSEEAVEAVLAEHEKELEELRFGHQVENAIVKAGGRSVRAVSAMLELEQIRTAEDPGSALEEAMKSLRKEHGYLFGREATPPPYAAGTGVRQELPEKVQSLAGALRERFKK